MQLAYLKYNFDFVIRNTADIFSKSCCIVVEWKFYHREFLDEQKAYLEATEPAADASIEDWRDYNAFVE